MSLRARPAEELVSSEVSWVGPIPRSWAMAPVKRVTSHVSRGMSPTYAEGGIPIINQACVYWDGLRWENVKFHDATVPVYSKALLSEADVLINATGTGTLGRATLFRPRVPDERVLADSHVTVVRTTHELEPRLLRYLLETDIYQGFVQSVLAVGATNQIELSRDGLRRTPVPLPAIDEQRTIAAFLDRKTAAIDALITKKERLIELLEEKRQALITQAVTKGLDPSVPMKDSGIEWLGPIPAHWGIAQLGWNLKFISYGFTNPMPSTDEGPYMVTANDIGDGEVLYDTARRTDVNECVKLTRKCRPQRGDILLTKDGTLGRVAVADGREMCVNQSVAVLTVNGRYGNTSFTQYALRCRTYQDRMLFEAGGTTIKHIYISRLAKMPIAFPPVEEQVVICQRVASLHGRFGPLVDRVHQTVRALREYRQALITAAVTGKIDLTAAADRKLPFEAGIG